MIQTRLYSTKEVWSVLELKLFINMHLYMVWPNDLELKLFINMHLYMVWPNDFNPVRLTATFDALCSLTAASSPAFLLLL